MCPRSWAAATPVKYKRDIQQLTYVLAIVKNSENNGTEEISLVTPTPGHFETAYCTVYSVLSPRLWYGGWFMWSIKMTILD